MTALLGGFESQPNFPYVDLNERNYSIIPVMLANRGFAQQIHAEGERLMPAFQLTHDAIRRGSSEIVEDSTRVRAISYGAAVFEVIAALVQSHQDASIADFAMTAGFFAALPSEGKVRNYMVDAADIFRADLPQTTEVVTEVSSMHGEDSTYALVGAALTRRLALDAETALGVVVSH